jgi:hypothetical protein
MTSLDEQRAKLKQSADFARELEKLFMERTDDMRIGFMASVIYAASSAQAMGMSLHDAMSAFMAVYKDAEKFSKEHDRG